MFRGCFKPTTDVQNCEWIHVWQEVGRYVRQIDAITYDRIEIFDNQSELNTNCLALEILNKRLSGKETEDKERQSQFEEVMKNKLAAERQQNEATLEALKKELSEKETELKRIC